MSSLIFGRQHKEAKGFENQSELTRKYKHWEREIQIHHLTLSNRAKNKRKTERGEKRERSKTMGKVRGSERGGRRRKRRRRGRRKKE